MSNASRRLVAFDKYKRVGPDYFGYYSSEVVNLLSQDEDALSVATQTSELAQYKYGEGGENLANHHDNFSGPLYSNGVGVGLSDFEKDRLRSLLRQSAISLSSEVDEVSDDLQFLLENASVDVEEMVKKYSDELSGTLGSMEQRLELLLDAAMSKCRSMTLGEKQQLQRSIQKLPAGNLDRVVEIICRSRPVEEQSCDEIFVDLEKENNATLWRLHYYVEAVEKARSLSCCEEA